MLPHQLSVPLDSFSKGVLASTGASLPAQPSGWATVHRACGSCRTQVQKNSHFFPELSDLGAEVGLAPGRLHGPLDVTLSIC